MYEDGRISRPKTDGEIQTLHLPSADGSRVFWSNGASLSLDELMEMLTSETGAEGAGCEGDENGVRKTKYKCIML